MTSFLLLFLVAIIIGACASYRLHQIEKGEKAGIHSLDKEMDAITEAKSKPVNRKESTYIGNDKQNRKIYCQDDSRHLFVVGTTGSGKTVLLSNFILSAVKKHYGLLLIDGKSDIGPGSMLSIVSEFCEKYHRKWYVIDMNHPEQSAPYNPFLGANATIAKDMLINLTDWTEEHYKVNTERYLQRLIQMLLDSEEPLSLENIIASLPQEAFEALSLQLRQKDKISKQQHTDNRELAKACAKIAEGATARFATLQESQVGKIFRRDGIDISTALQEKAVILFVLNPLLYPETSAVLGRLALIDAKKAVSKLFGNQERTFFILDEINVYASSILVDLINKSRSAGITCIPATQSLADLDINKEDKLKRQIIENCNNYVILRQNTYQSAEEMAKVIGTVERMKMTYQVSSSESNGKGSARRVREFIVHPDEIKAQKTGEAIFVSRDNGSCVRLKVHKPF